MTQYRVIAVHLYTIYVYTYGFLVFTETYSEGNIWIGIIGTDRGYTSTEKMLVIYYFMHILYKKLVGLRWLWCITTSRHYLLCIIYIYIYGARSCYRPITGKKQHRNTPTISTPAHLLFPLHTLGHTASEDTSQTRTAQCLRVLLYLYMHHVYDIVLLLLCV